MHVLRRLLAARHAAALICAAALLVKLLVPAGYMVGGEGGRVTVMLCSGVAGRMVASPAMTMPGAAMPGMAMPDAGGGRPDRRGPQDHGKAEMPCAFSGAAIHALGAIDPIQLEALVAFIAAAGRAPAILAAPAPATRLRPPLRGPPAAL